MKNTNTTQVGFADLAVSKRKVKDEFFNQINTIIDWKPIAKYISKYYQKGESAIGRPSYEGIVLFKITLLQTWYGLSDYEVEEQVNDRISFSRFVGISMDEKSPDHSVISRFRTVLTNKRAYDKLLKKINEQLEKHQIIVKQGVIIDASVTETHRKPRGKKIYEAVEDRNEEQAVVVKAEEKVQPGVDTQAKWIKKAGKLKFGFKQHTATDEQGLVLGVITTPANESDIKHLSDVIDVVAPTPGTWIKADKGYKSEENDNEIKRRRLKNHIMHKAKKNKKLSERESKANKLISKIRYKVERTFGSIKNWFRGGVARYVGLEKMHTQHLMEAIAYNLYRSPGIIMSKN